MAAAAACESRCADVGEGAPPWSLTASCPPRDDREALVVCHVPLSALEIDDLVEDVVYRCGEAEGERWRYARAEEYAASLVNALHMRISNAELIVHIDAAATADRVQVMLASSDDPSEAERRESDVIDRVEAIRQMAHNDWRRGLRDTVSRLNDL